MCCCKCFDIHSLFLTHHDHSDFTTIKWLPLPGIYAIWSTVLSIYTMVMSLYMTSVSHHGHKVIIWLTYWTFYTLTIRFAVTAFNTWRHVLGQSDSIEPCDEEGRKITHYLPPALALQWLLQNISNNVSLLVTILFWGLVYSGQPLQFTGINSHGINSVLVVADLMMSAAPVRMIHFHIPLTFLIIYTNFTLLYWAGGGTNIRDQPYTYEFLNYSGKPVTAAVAILCVAVVAVPLTQLILCGIHRLREHMFSRIQIWKRRANGRPSFRRQ